MTLTEREVISRGVEPALSKRTVSEMADKSQRCQQRKDTFHIAMRRSVGFTGGLRRNCAPRLSHYGVAALADAEGAVAHHTNITDAFYVLEGQMRLFLQDPKEEVNLKPGEIHVVEAARPHLVPGIRAK